MKDICEYIDAINKMDEAIFNWQYVEGGNHEEEISEMEKKNGEMFDKLVEKYGMDVVLQEIMG